MKRLLSILSLILLVSTLMTACGGDKNSDDDTVVYDDTIYGKLSAAVNYEGYTGLTVTVTTTDKDGLVLTSIYDYETVSSGLKIDYLIEKLGQFEIVDGIYTAPEEMVELIEGSVILSGGEIIASNGDAAPTNLSSAKYPSFKFSEDYFSSVEYTDTEFKADVLSPLAFIGMTDSCSNMKLSLTYSDDVIETVVLTYNGADGSTVNAEYIYE